MGASQSDSRTVTIENPNPQGVIYLSDEVVQRLKAGLKERKAEEKLIKQQQENIPPANEPTKTLPTSSPQLPLVTATAPAPQVTIHREGSTPPHIIYHNELSPSSMQMQKQKEIELQENDLYWRKRFSQLETNVQKTNETLEQEFEESMQNVRKRFRKAAPSHRLPICQDEHRKVLECYKLNASSPLLCSHLVHEFTNCINEHRVKLLDAKAIQVDQNNNK